MKKQFLKLREKGLSYRKIGDRYGVSKQYVWAVVNPNGKVVVIKKKEIIPRLTGLYLNIIRRVKEAEKHNLSKKYINGLKDSLKMARHCDPLLKLIN